MTIKREQIPHMLIVRFAEDGQGIAGAQIDYLERLTDGDDLLSERILPPVPLAGQTELEPLLGQVVLAQAATLEGQRAEMQAIQQQAQSRLDQGQRETQATLEAERAAWQQERLSLGQQLHEARQVSEAALREREVALSAQAEAERQRETALAEVQTQRQEHRGLLARLIG